MNKICCFAGHREVLEENALRQALYLKCEELILESGVDCFWVGNYGRFDRLAALIVEKLKEKYSYIRLELVLPYITKSMTDFDEQFYKKFDNIIIAQIPESTPIKFKILKCNRYMVDCSDFLIGYVNYSFGGASKTFEYAKKKGTIEIYNLGSYLG